MLLAKICILFPSVGKHFHGLELFFSKHSPRLRRGICPGDLLHDACDATPFWQFTVLSDEPCHTIRPIATETFNRLVS